MDLIKLFILLKKIKASVCKDLPVIISYLEELQINAFILLSFIFVQFSYIIQIWTSHIQILLFESLLLFPIRFYIPGVFPSNHYIFFPIFLLVFLSILKRMHMICFYRFIYNIKCIYTCLPFTWTGCIEVKTRF